MNDTSNELPLLPLRSADAHKGNFGSALIVGGSRGMAGAAGLAGMAALRGGAGLVRLAVPDGCLETIAGFEPSYVTVALPSDPTGRISVGALDRIMELTDWATTIACGPGLGRSADLDHLVNRLYREIDKPMVFDADALNALAVDPEVLAHPGGPRILTPHPGEFARLIGKKLDGDKPASRQPSEGHGGNEAGSDETSLAAPSARQQAAIDLAERCGIVVVLKGHSTLVTDGRRYAVNPTGNPGMATGGSGDVLTGVITALVCQHLEPYAAAQLGVYLHGLAGDLAAAELGQVSMIASDLVRFLPKAFQRAVVV